MRRRDFLRGAAALGAGLGAGLGRSPLGGGRALAFGEAPGGAASSLLPDALRADSVLEIFLYGGVSQYESFYCVPEHGAADATGWHAFAHTGLVEQAVTACGFPDAPLLEPFATDAAGQLVHLGPFVAPLRARPDLVDRLRVAITAHDLEPHEGAIPLALAGRRLGHPALAGLGAHVQRYFLERDGALGRAPYAYVLLARSAAALPMDNVRSATAIGLHPGAARPLALTVDAKTDPTALLARPGVGERRAAHDALLDVYLERERARLGWGGAGDPLRAPRLADLAAANASLASADAIGQVLDPSFFQIVQGSACGDAAADGVGMSLRLAAHLLTQPEQRARYVCVIDGGLVPADGGGGYDSHQENSHTQARNLSHTLRTLASLIATPGERDPRKIDLDHTLVVLTTEFGRSPQKQGDRGRNHWPYGYPVVFLGGPVRARGVFGATGADARATLAGGPQENRVAALLALGIWPFAQESYNVSDVLGAATEAEAARLVLERQLGVAL
jgi:hypothetical protein